jgi:hypothetical protein
MTKKGGQPTWETTAADTGPTNVRDKADNADKSANWKAL